jgi:hypothetical protein
MLSKTLSGSSTAPAQYKIERSLRFNSADSAYLNRTPASAGNRKTWTWSGWVKRSKSDTFNTLFVGNSAGNSDTTFTQILFRSDQLQVNGYSTVWRRSTAVFRDFSAWYHVVVAFDTTQSTASNRVKVYINGSQITNFEISNDPTQNTDYGINQAASHTLGSVGSGELYDGYMADINFIDGSAKTPSDFGETDTDTGVWKPKSYTGTYGTNGFYLQFADNSGTTSTTLGKDTSGNSNNWTPNNFSVTAGIGNDSLVDSPTAYGTDTGAGGEVRGNYCTLNPTAVNASYPLSTYTANGNLQITAPGVGTYYNGWASMVPTDKVYIEFKFDSATDYFALGLQDINSAILGNSYLGSSSSNAIGFGDLGFSDWVIYNNGTETRTGTTLSSGATLMMAYDPSTRKIWFGVNGTWYNSGNPASGTNQVATLSTSLTYIPAFTVRGNASGYVNFGQRAYTYSAPSGFKALCTTNLATPAIGATSSTQANDYFNTVLYTGTGATRSITGVGFAPDFVWNKGRSNAVDHCLNDIVRGANKQLVSNTTGAELTYTNQLTSFDSDGFSLGADNLGYTNYNNVTYAAWCWKGGGTGVSNTAGTISSTVSANTTSGCSIVTYTGNGTSNSSVGHGLGATPVVAIIKSRSQSGENWHSYWSVLGQTKDLQLNTTDAAFTYTSPNIWGSTSWSSTLFYLGSQTGINSNGSTYVAYCFAPVAGFSAFGSYTGNGSIPGPFVYTGFRPAWVLIKRATNAGMDWVLYDNKRTTENVMNDWLYPNLSNSEQLNDSYNHLDFVSNGFKVAPSGSVGNYNNTNGETFIYAAFAEFPYKFSLAR